MHIEASSKEAAEELAYAKFDELEHWDADTVDDFCVDYVQELKK